MFGCRHLWNLTLCFKKLCENRKELCKRKLSKWKERSDDSTIPMCWLFCFWCGNLCWQYSLCNEGLIELSNSGASGSLFYLSSDDEFIIKTVQHKEAEFLQKLLPGYFMVRLDRTFTGPLNVVLCPTQNNRLTTFKWNTFQYICTISILC